MKLLFVGSEVNLGLDKIGGIESTMTELISYLIRNNHNVKVVLIDKLVNKPINSKFNNNIAFSKMNIKDVRKEICNNYDAINFLQTPFENIFFAIYFLLLKIIGRVHSTKFYFTYEALQKSTFLQKLKLKLLINQTLTFSPRIKELAKTITSNVEFLSPPVAKYYFENKSKKINNKIKILFVGRLSQDKGLDIVIDVFKNLSKEKFHLAIIGYFVNDADNKTYSEKIEKLNLDLTLIKDHSVTNNKKVFLPLNEFDILLLPYKNLGPTLDTPLLVLEGLVSDCKVIVPRIGNLDKISDDLFIVEKESDYTDYTVMINKVAHLKTSNNVNDYSTDSFGEKFIEILNRKL